MDRSQEYDGARYRWTYTPVDTRTTRNISVKHNIPSPLAEVLVKRNIISDSQIEEYFQTPLSSLINPFLMRDMQKGVERICLALANGESICIYGDYDADGVTATALMYLFLRELGANVDYYIPKRLEEGYGLSLAAVEELYKKHVNLIITVDCGISAIEEVSRAASLGMDVVVTDHHQQGDDLPDAAIAIINPMMQDETYSFKHLSGVGVAFKLCMAIRHNLRSISGWADKPLPNLKQYLDLVTLGTVADVVPLQSENRTFVVHGLKVLSGKTRVGIEELKKVTGYGTELNTYKVGYGLVPRLNAVGRLGDADRSLRLLIATEQNTAQYLAKQMNEDNEARKGIEKGIVDEVYKKIDKEGLAAQRRGLVLYSDKWHAGVLGIVASRVADKYRRPTIVLTLENGIYRGSARSIQAFHLYDGIKELSDILLSFGGHKYAAGVKLEATHIGELEERFDAIVRKALNDKDYMPELVVDAILQPSDLTSDFMFSLHKFEPFGNSNHDPLFCIKNFSFAQPATFSEKDGHIKCFFEHNGRNYEAIGFNMRATHGAIIRSAKSFDVLFTLASYGKQHIPQLILKDLRGST